MDNGDPFDAEIQAVEAIKALREEQAARIEVDPCVRSHINGALPQIELEPTDDALQSLSGGSRGK